MSAIASEEQTNTTQAQRQKTTLSRVRVSFKVALSECTVEGSQLLRTLNLITGCGSKSCICGNWQELWQVVQVLTEQSSPQTITVPPPCLIDMFAVM